MKKIFLPNVKTKLPKALAACKNEGRQDYAEITHHFICGKLAQGVQEAHNVAALVPILEVFIGKDIHTG